MSSRTTSGSTPRARPRSGTSAWRWPTASTGPSAGTPRYAAPEQLIGDPVERAHRPVLARHHALRAAHGPAAVRRHRPVPDAPARAALEPRARDPRGARRARAVAARPRPERPARRRRRRRRRGSAELGGSELPAGVIGRAPELERLRAALTQAWNGAARTIVVAGEPGIGKTTLLDALAAEAVRRGGVALWGRADPEDRAYGVWRVGAARAPRRPDAALARLLGGEGDAGRRAGPAAAVRRASRTALGGAPPPTSRCSWSSTTCTGPTPRRCACSLTSSTPSPARGC